MELQLNHPETRSYTVADVKVSSHKSEEYSYVSLFITPRDKTYPISLTLGKENWIELIAETSRALMEIK